jgi:hypothetical protein
MYRLNNYDRIQTKSMEGEILMDKDEMMMAGS